MQEINKQVCSNYATAMTRVPLSFDLLNKYVYTYILFTDIYERTTQVHNILYILITRSVLAVQAL